MQSLYERLGGAPAIERAVEIFYRKMLKDERVARFFDEADMDRQIAKQKAFLTMATGGPNGYTGRDLRTAHAPLVERGLNGTHVDAVIEHLGDTLRELGVEQPLIDEVAQLCESVRGDVLHRPPAV